MLKVKFMTFQRSLIVSLGIHILFFGSALAFAHYGHLLGKSAVIAVTLVGSDQITGGKTQNTSLSRNMQPGIPRPALRDAGLSQKADINELQPALTATKASSHGTLQNDGTSEPKMIRQDTGGEPGSRPGILTPDQWQLIQAALERVKTYPRIARERGIEGVVHVRFKILPSGNADSVEILKSSGSKILDSASINTVYRSGPLPHVNGWIAVPIAYSISK